ncbi:MAG: hypothetical protein JW931_08680 [Methanomicrobiaceae archaeon]|nr:hypothetical protein [Methanomicrobiaceae archaeon]
MHQKNRLYKVLIAIFFINSIIYGVSAEPYVELFITPALQESYTTGIPVYSYGEEIVMNITLTNKGPGPVTIMGVPPLMGISHKGEPDFLKYQRSNVAKVLNENKSCETLLIWDQKDEAGIQVEPGEYTIGVYYLYSPGDNGGIWDLSNIRQMTRTKDILINPRQGTLQADLIFNDVKQDKGVTVTLVSLDCNTTEGVVVFDVEIPEKSVDTTPRPEGLVPCDVNAYPIGSYSIDEGEQKNFLDTYWICDTGPTQVHRIYMVFEPIPADAKTMDIRITQIGNHEGTWDFHIELEPEPQRQQSPGFGFSLIACGLGISIIIIFMRKN